MTLKYYEIGNNDVNTREAVQDAINALFEPLINANFEFQIIGWGDWDNKALTAFLRAYASGMISLPEGMMEKEAAADPDTMEGADDEE